MKKMLYSFKLYSHQNKLLIDHLRNVGKLSEAFIKNLKLNVSHVEILNKIAYLIGISHDFGKGTIFFQKKIKENLNKENAYHSYLSSLFAFWITKKFLEKISKQELSYLSLFSWLIVAEHHGELKNFSEVKGDIQDSEGIIYKQIKNIKKNSLKELNNIYKLLLKELDLNIDISEFLNEIDKILEEIEDKLEEFENKDIDKYFELILLYSVLIDADRLDASCENKENLEELKKILMGREELNADLVDNYKKRKFKKKSKINKIREEAYKDIISKLDKINLEKDKIFSLELPTGIGKTLSSFSFALKLRKKIEKEKGYKPRIIYSLPFLSIIDQNAKVINDVLNYQFQKGVPTNIFLKHHHLSDKNYRILKKDESLKEYEKDRALLLIESWYSEIIITTFVQFFESLISVKNRSIRKIHNIANSIIILDEFQALPYEYWKLAREVIKFLAKKWNCYVIIMTATMPVIFEKKEIFQLINKPERYFKNENLNRYTLYIDHKIKDLKQFFKEIIKITEKTNKNILIILNTIKSSQEFYSLMRNHFVEKEGEPKITDEGVAEFKNFYLINLNSNIIPFHRLKRIKKIKEEKKRKIIISTQLVEAGVDIDVDIVYRDFAPIDSIVQSAGRCNRNGRKKGEVFLVKLKNSKGNLYSKIIYGLISYDITRTILQNKQKIEEKEIRDLISKHFNDIQKKTRTSKYFDSVCELNFSGIKEPISKFSLINNEHEKLDFCICFNNAKEIILKIMELKKQRMNEGYKNKFKISAKIKDLKRKLDNFIISSTLSEESVIAYQSNKNLWGIIIVDDPIEIKKIYDIEKGFILDENKDFEDRFL